MLMYSNVYLSISVGCFSLSKAG